MKNDKLVLKFKKITDMKRIIFSSLLFLGIFFGNTCIAQDNQNLPIIDISGETDRHVIIAAGSVCSESDFHTGFQYIGNTCSSA